MEKVGGIKYEENDDSFIKMLSVMQYGWLLCSENFFNLIKILI